MTKRKKAPRLLASELEILEMLWRSGPVTIVEAQRALGSSAGYTTVQTRLNRLVKKAVVRRSPERPAKYVAAIEPEEVVTGDLNMLLEKVSRGRVVPLVAHLVKDRSLSKAEVEELTKLIEEAEQQTPPENMEARKP